jgi:hypothetical protein
LLRRTTVQNRITVKPKSEYESRKIPKIRDIKMILLSWYIPYAIKEQNIILIVYLVFVTLFFRVSSLPFLWIFDTHTRLMSVKRGTG